MKIKAVVVFLVFVTAVAIVLLFDKRPSYHTHAIQRTDAGIEVIGYR